MTSLFIYLFSLLLLLFILIFFWLESWNCSRACGFMKLWWKLKHIDRDSEWYDYVVPTKENIFTLSSCSKNNNKKESVKKQWRAWLCLLVLFLCFFCFFLFFLFFFEYILIRRKRTTRKAQIFFHPHFPSLKHEKGNHIMFLLSFLAFWFKILSHKIRVPDRALMLRKKTFWIQ